MLLDLVKLLDQARRAHKIGCRCRECREASSLIDGGARAFSKLREPPRVEATPADGQQVSGNAPASSPEVVADVVAEVEGEPSGGVRRWGREGR